MLIALDDDELVQAGHMAEDVFVRQMKRRRTALGLSQAQLANRITDLGGSLYQQTIAKIEAGQRAVRLQEADLIAQALRSTVSEMLALSIGDPESSPETMDIDELIAQLKALQRRRDAYTSSLHQAREDEARALEAVQAATHRATMASSEARRVATHLEEIERELHHLSRVSLSRQSELNARFGPRWREELSIRQPISVKSLLPTEAPDLKKLRELAAAADPKNHAEQKRLRKEIEALERKMGSHEAEGEEEA